MEKFKVGKSYKIIGRSGDIVHHFEIGEKVTLVIIAVNGEGHLYEKKDGIIQYVSDCDVRECRNTRNIFSRIFGRKRKGE